MTNPLSPYAENFRKLRAAIDVALRDLEVAEGPAKGGSVVLVSSSLPAEGKSTAALALARTYAKSGVKTLLLDVDLRKPVQAQYLGVTSEYGLLHFLRSDNPSSHQVIRPVRDPLSNLVAITAGGRSTEPTDQLINSAEFRGLLATARAQYSMIILDSPPILPVVDTRYLAQFADAVIQVVRYVTTTQGEVREAAQLLRELMRPNVELLGVLSHEPTEVRKSGYYGSYYGDDATENDQ